MPGQDCILAVLTKHRNIILSNKKASIELAFLFNDLKNNIM
jgi:hypothetical protein